MNPNGPWCQSPVPAWRHCSESALNRGCSHSPGRCISSGSKGGGTWSKPRSWTWRHQSAPSRVPDSMSRTQGTDVVDLRGAEAVPVLLFHPEQAGKAALEHQFPGGGRLRFLDVKLLEPLLQQVRDLLWRQGGQEGQRGDELGVLDGRRGDQVREPVAGLGPRRTSAPSRSPSSSTAPTYMCPLCPLYPFLAFRSSIGRFVTL